MLFTSVEISAILNASPEFKFVQDHYREMFCYSDGTYEQTITKSAYGFEWTNEELNDPDPWPDGDNYREFGDLETLLKFLKGE